MDLYYKKTITYELNKIHFSFDVGNTLFSTFEIDHGTDVLIRAIETGEPKTILDLGCGYGPIGIILAKINPLSKVTMVDRDLLAIRYSKLNIAKNNLTNATAFASVGMEELINRTFDLIVSNIPAKIGDEAITNEFILSPFKQLTPQGELWIVVVNSLNRLIPKIGRQHKLSLKLVKKRNGHTVYRIKKAGAVQD